VLCLALIYLQLIVGAVMRHFQAGLAIPDLPLAYGKLLPPISDQAVNEVNAWRATQDGLAPVTLGQIWIHFAHRLGAVVLAIVLGHLVHQIARNSRELKLLMRPAWWLTGLFFLQIALGILVVLLQKPADVTSAHVAVGALVLLTTFVIAVRARRLSASRQTLVPAVTVA